MNGNGGLLLVIVEDEEIVPFRDVIHSESEGYSVLYLGEDLAEQRIVSCHCFGLYRGHPEVAPVELIDLDNCLVGAAAKSGALKIPVCEVPIDAVGNSRALDLRGNQGTIQATDGVADDLRTVGAGSLLHIVKLHDFTLGETGAEVLNHSDFGSQEDGVDVAVGLGYHKGGNFQGLAVSGDDVGVVHDAYYLALNKSCWYFGTHFNSKDSTL